MMERKLAPPHLGQPTSANHPNPQHRNENSKFGLNDPPPAAPEKRDPAINLRHLLQPNLPATHLQTPAATQKQKKEPVTTTTTTKLKTHALPPPQRTNHRVAETPKTPKQRRRTGENDGEGDLKSSHQ
ncbi:hypothetical protein P8452_45266 [Trifolium repens]|nr:hypothetical protein P8452_45266 [Trifolium repens]